MAFPQSWAGSYRCCFHESLSRQFLMKTLIFLTIIQHEVSLLAWSISDWASIHSVFNNSQPWCRFLEAPQRAAWAHAGMQAKPRLPPVLSPLGLHLQCSDEVAWEKHQFRTGDLLCSCCQENYSFCCGLLVLQQAGKVTWLLNQLCISNATEIWQAGSGGKVSFVAGNICQMASAECSAKYFYWLEVFDLVIVGMLVMHV